MVRKLERADDWYNITSFFFYRTMLPANYIFITTGGLNFFLYAFLESTTKSREWKDIHVQSNIRFIVREAVSIATTFSVYLNKLHGTGLWRNRWLPWGAMFHGSLIEYYMIQDLSHSKFTAFHFGEVRTQQIQTWAKKVKVVWIM